MQDKPKNFGLKKPFPNLQLPRKMTTVHSIDWDVMQRNAKKDFSKFGVKRLTHQS
jgi:hypothetical protein